MRQACFAGPRTRASAHDRRATDAVWCGARNGGTLTSGRSGGSNPATEWIRVTSSAWSGGSRGRIPGKRRASIVLPVPGGPPSRRLCPPAAASSSARRARSWPRTSARSGLSRFRSRSRSATSSRPAAARPSRRAGRRPPPRDGAAEPARSPQGPPPQRRLRSAEEPRQPGLPRPFCRRQDAADRAQPPVERELADGGVPDERVGRHLPRGRQHRQRDRQVEARALLPELGRGEVDGDPAQWPLELGRGDPAPHPLLRLLARAVGEADDRERRQAPLEVRLDLHPAGVEADKRMRDRSCEHVSTLEQRLG